MTTQDVDEAMEVVGNSIKRWTVGFVQELGDISLFAWKSLSQWFERPYRINELVKHMEFVGNKSVGIICLTGLFTGLVFSFQAWLGLSIVNADNLVGPTAALGIARELGPVLTGLIIAARAGGAMAAQLGSMKVSEQIDALMVMGVDPQQYLVSPRIVAAVISTPMMCAVFDFVALIGTYVLSIHVLGLDVGVFVEKIRDFVEPKDIGEGLLKSAIFGFIFSVICTYRGFNADGGARGVGDATNRGVVASMVMIIVADYFITRLYRIFVKTVLI